MSIEATFIGRVNAVSGAAIEVHLARSIDSGFAIIDGQTYRAGQVGTFVRVPQGYQDLFGFISEVGASPTTEDVRQTDLDAKRWIRVQLVGEAIGSNFERGIGQYPNIGDEVHIVTGSDLARIYGKESPGMLEFGRLSSAENIPVTVDINALVNKHSAVIGSTGSGKSTAVTSLIRAIAASDGERSPFPGARIVLLDIHGEYSAALRDISYVYKVNADSSIGEKELFVPYWSLNATEIISVFGSSFSDKQESGILDRIYQLKRERLDLAPISGVDERNLTVDTPIPFSLKRLWFDLIDFESRTFKDNGGENPTECKAGDVETLIAPEYQPASPGSAAPFLNKTALGIRRHLDVLKSRLLDHRYDFLLRPGDWETDKDGNCAADLEQLLASWVGHDRSVTILDLSGIPSEFLDIIIGKIFSIIYEAMFWGRKLEDGSRTRPILFVMEEAHRYLSNNVDGAAKQLTQRIVKEGRKYGMGTMIVSQRPVEIDDTILSQCGTFFALRLSNSSDRSKVQGALPDSMAGLVDMLPVLRAGEALVIGEAAKLPVRCRIHFPREEFRPDSADPSVSEAWANTRRSGDYSEIVKRWRAKSLNPD